MPSARSPRGMPRGRRALVGAAAALVGIFAGCSADRAPAPVPSVSTITRSVTSTVTAEASDSPTGRTLRDGFQTALPAIVRLDQAGCTLATGSGFAISPELVVTAAHVVDDIGPLRVTNHAMSTTGVVVGIDRGKDVALVRLGQATAGSVDFEDEAPKLGDDIVVIGYKEGQGVTYTAGSINGIGRKATVGGIARSGLIEIDAAANVGNSGGPLVNAAGAVVGMLIAGPGDGSQGGRLAVPADRISGLVSDWAFAPSTVRGTDPGCDTVWQPGGRPFEEAATAEQAAAALTLTIYFDAINLGDYETALAQLADPPALADFVDSVTSSRDGNFGILAMGSQDGRPTIQLSFTSEQDPGKGPTDRPEETCTLWHLEYLFAQEAGVWHIDGTRAIAGLPQNQPCQTGD